MMPTRDSGTITPVTIMRARYVNASGFQKGGIFALGAMFLCGTMFFSYLDIVKNHTHTTMETIMRIAILVAGLMMIIPGPTLKLLEIIPLPAFMHREDRRRHDDGEDESCEKESNQSKESKE